MTEEVARQEPTAEAPTTPEGSSPSPDATSSHGAVPAVPPPPPDDENPALIDARKTFIITVLSAGLFIAAVVLFIL